MINTPDTFVNLAVSEGLSKNIAHEFYHRKANLKPVDDLLLRSVSENCYTNISDARKAFSFIWKNWSSFTKTGLMVDLNEVYTPEVLPYMTQPVSVDETSMLERAYEGLETMIGKCKTVKGTPKPNAELEALVTSDYHLPFCHEETLNAILKSKARKLYIAGDFSDMYSAQSHRPSIDYITATEELAVSRAVLEELATKFEEIIMIEGNHENRVIKKAQTLVPQLLPLIIHPLQVLSYGLENVKLASLSIPKSAPMVNYGKDIELGFTAVDDDMLIGHFEEFCGDDAPVKLEEWLQKFSHKLPIDISNLKTIFQAHTHRLNMRYTAKGRLLISSGCVCEVQEYVWKHHSKYSPPTPGFIELYKDPISQKIDYTRTRMVYTG